MKIPNKELKRIAELEKKVQDLKRELSNIKNYKKKKDPSILNDQFSEEINLEKLKNKK